VHRRQHVARNVEDLQQLVVPLVAAHIEHQSARRVAHIGGVHRAAGQLPHQPGVDGAEGELAACRCGTCAGHVVEDPLELRAGKIRVEDQPGLVAERLFEALFAQRRAGRLGTPVLPDDGVVDRFAGLAIPHDRGLALVRDADRCHVTRRHAGLGQRLLRGRELRGPDLLRIVFDPARLRIDLAELALRHRDDAALAVEHDAARARGALVEGEQKVLVGHLTSPTARPRR
jgi:hypothetical protein